MTDHEINQAIHDHLGLPRTVTRWKFRIQHFGGGTEECRPYLSEEDALRGIAEITEWAGYVVRAPESYELPVRVKDYCNDRDAMADAITTLGEDIVYNLIPNQGTPDEDGGYNTHEVFHLLTRPCRDLAVAFYKTIHPDKITP